MYPPRSCLYLHLLEFHAMTADIFGGNEYLYLVL